MSHANYGPRCTVHPDRYGVVKTVPNLWVILHTSEGGESVSAAENLCSFMGSPGDRPLGSGRYGSSYHVVFDTDRVIPAVPYNTVSYSAVGGNAQGIHGCFPGRAAQTREQWLDPVSRAMIRQCAAWLCDISAEFGIPVDRKMPSYEMLAGDKGLGDHYTVTVAFGKSTHTDVGSGFPWDVLFGDVRDILAPPINIQEDDDMALIAYILQPPPERQGSPWLAVVDGDVRPATSYDIASKKLPVHQETNPYRGEQYDFLRKAAGV